MKHRAFTILQVSEVKHSGNARHSPSYRWVTWSIQGMPGIHHPTGEWLHMSIQRMPGIHHPTGEWSEAFRECQAFTILHVSDVKHSGNARHSPSCRWVKWSIQGMPGIHHPTGEWLHMSIQGMPGIHHPTGEWSEAFRECQAFTILQVSDMKNSGNARHSPSYRWVTWSIQGMPDIQHPTGEWREALKNTSRIFLLVYIFNYQLLIFLSKSKIIFLKLSNYKTFQKYFALSVQ